MTTLTLNEIRAHHPCASGWTKALKALGKTEADDTRVTFAWITENNGIEDALWALRCLPDRERWWIGVLARSYAAHVMHLWDAPKEVKDFLWAGDESLRGAAARAATEAAARAATESAARAATEAARAARAAEAAEAAAWAAAWAARAARAAEAAALAAAWAARAARAALAAERKWQAQELLRVMDLPDVPESRIVNF